MLDRNRKIVMDGLDHKREVLRQLELFLGTKIMKRRRDGRKERLKL